MAWYVKPRKYVKGDPITEPLAVILAVMADDYVFWRGRPLHPKILRNWSIARFFTKATYGHFHRAEINPEWAKQQIEEDLPF